MQSFHYYSIFNIWKCYFTRGIVVTVSWNDWGCQGLLSPLGLTSPPAGTPKAGCPDSFWRPPRRRPHNVWAICSSAQVRSTAWCSEGTSCIPVCAHCLFVLALDTTNKSLVPSSLSLPLEYLQTLIRFSLTYPILRLLQTKLLHCPWKQSHT